MNAWDIDPSPNLPVYRALYQRLKVSFRRLFNGRRRAAAPPAGCRG